jgi:general secretion pathway protein L
MTLLFLDEPHAEQAIHCRLEQGRIADSHQINLADAAGTIDDETDGVTVVIPGEAVTTLRVSVPKTSPRQINKAIPYLVEENLASPVEALHFATGPVQAGSTLVAMIDKTLVNAYLENLQGFDIRPIALIPDFFLLAPETGARVMALDDRVLVRLPDGAGYSFRGLDPAFVLAGLNEAPEKTESGTLIDLGLPQSLPLNLLQGEFRIHSHRGTAAFPTRKLAVASAACLLAFVAYFAGAGLVFHQRAQALQNEATELYRTLFPDERRIVSIRRQMEGHLRSAASTDSSSGFFELLTVFSDALAIVDGNHETRRVRFDQKNGNLLAEWQTNSLASAQRLQEKVREAGASLAILSATKNDRGLVVNLKLGMDRQQ